MSKFNLHWQTVLAAIVFVAALFLLPLTGSATSETTTAILVVTAAAIVISALDFGPAGAWALLVPSHIAVFLLIGAIAGAEGSASWSFFLVLVTCWLLAWRVVTMLSGDGSKHSGGGFAGRILVPTLFGVWLLILWEAITRGAGVPFVLLPPPSAIGARILTAVPTLAADFRQTVLMTFFPMLVNTLEGLKTAGHMERDLMRTYGSSHWQTLFKLRLPAAMPFVFNALKINSTLALIGALVAEFFGTPVVGMGFRISTEVGRMNLDMVWAEIALAALVGSLFYGAIALLERAVTFWHPSYR